MRLGEKSIKIWNFLENFKNFIQKSKWKIDFLPIFSPFFQDLSRMFAKLDWRAGAGLVVVDPGLGVISRMGVGDCINPWKNWPKTFHGPLSRKIQHTYIIVDRSGHLHSNDSFLFAVIVVFEEEVKIEHFFERLANLSLALEIANHSLNSWVYCIRIKMYREELIKLFKSAFCMRTQNPPELRRNQIGVP